MKRSDHTEETKLEPEVERELDAIERALAGLPVDEEMASLASLVTEIQAERPQPAAEFAAELDRRAAAGFDGGGRSRRAGWLGGLQLRALMPAAGALATLAIVAAVGIGVTSGDRGGDRELNSTTLAPQSKASSAGTAGSSTVGGAAAGAEAAPEAAGSVTLDEMPPTDVGGFSSAGDVAVGSGSGAQGKIAPGRSKRQQDRSARLQLKTETSKVREVSDEAIQITESVGGVVTSSELSEQTEGATASLELAIPTRALDSTLDQLTDLATVASLNEASVDITKPFVSAQNELADARAKREKLLEALGSADNKRKAAAIEAQIDAVRREISRAKASFDNVARRARMSNVSLQIEGTPNGDDDGSWGLGDAADDALDALKTVAGVMLVGAAIVVPVGIVLALLGWLAIAGRRRSREKVLDEN